MTWLKTYLNRFLALFCRRELEERLHEEVRLHLEMDVGENLRRGMSGSAPAAWLAVLGL